MYWGYYCKTCNTSSARWAEDPPTDGQRHDDRHETDRAEECVEDEWPTRQRLEKRQNAPERDEAVVDRRTVEHEEDGEDGCGDEEEEQRCAPSRRIR